MRTSETAVREGLVAVRQIRRRTAIERSSTTSEVDGADGADDEEADPDVSDEIAANKTR